MLYLGAVLAYKDRVNLVITLKIRIRQKQQWSKNKKNKKILRFLYLKLLKNKERTMENNRRKIAKNNKNKWKMKSRS